MSFPPPLGTFDVPYWEWWLHNNPFRKYYGEAGRQSCKICASDTGCWGHCPYGKIQEKLAEIKQLIQEWKGRGEA